MPLLFVAGYVVFVAYTTSWADVSALADAAVAPLRNVLGR
jgi:hypothetical protein